MGDGLQGVFHAHRPQGWAPTSYKDKNVCMADKNMGHSNFIGSNQQIPSRLKKLHHSLEWGGAG